MKEKFCKNKFTKFTNRKYESIRSKNRAKNKGF